MRRFHESVRIERAWVLCLAVTLVTACHSAPSTAARSGTGEHAPQASVSASAPTRPAKPARAARPRLAPPDTAFQHFEKKLDKLCAQPDGATTAALVQAGTATTRCLREIVLKKARELPEAARAALAAGPQDPIVKDTWSPAWLRFEDSVCAIEDVDKYANGIRRAVGTMRYVDEAYCGEHPYIEAAFLLHGLAKGDAAGFAQHVLATAPAGRDRLAATRRALPGVERLRRLAPEDSLFNEECWDCVMADADWRRVELRLRAILDESKTLGRAVCRSWPDLRKRLGSGCDELVREHFASYLAKGPEPFGQGITAGDYQGLPPPKDPAYRAVIEPVIDACRRNENLHYSDVVFERKYLGCLRQHFAKLAASTPGWSRVRSKWTRFEHALCQVEDDAARSGLLSASGGRLEGEPMFDAGSLECPALTTARGIFVVHALSGNDTTTFAAHVGARKSWIPIVEKGMKRLSDTAHARTCKDDIRLLPKGCRPRTLSTRRWALVGPHLARLGPAAAALGKSLCNAWPALDARFSDCSSRLRDYFLSYSMFGGLVGIDQDRYW